MPWHSLADLELPVIGILGCMARTDNSLKALAQRPATLLVWVVMIQCGQ